MDNDLNKGQYKDTESGDVRRFNPWLIFTVILTGTFLGPFSGSILNVSLPSISSEYGIDLQTVKWVVLIYLLMGTALLPIVGKVGNWFGQGKLYNIGFIVFAGASVCCALSPGNNVHWLVTFRLVQAIGSALMFGMSPALVTRYIPAEKRGLAFGIIGSVVAAALIIGPPLGVVLCEAANWRWVFWVLVPVAGAGSILSFYLLPPEKFKGKFHLPIAGTIGWLCVVTGLVLIGEAFSSGMWLSSITLVSLLTGLALLVFIYSELKLEPLFYYGIFRFAAFWRGALGSVTIYTAIAILILFMPFYLEDYLKLSTLSRAVIFSLSPLTTVFVGPIAGNLADRVGFRLPVISGLMVTTLCFAAMAIAVVYNNLILFAVGYGLMGVGSGLFAGPNFSAMMGSVSPDQRSQASSTVSLTRSLGFLVGISAGSLVFGVLLSIIGGKELMQAASTKELIEAVTFDEFRLVFSRLLVICAMMMTGAVLISLKFPNRLTSANSAVHEPDLLQQ